MAGWHSVTSRSAEFLQAAAERPAALLLALDFDGTLAPIVTNPEDSRLDERAAAALTKLVPHVGQIAIISGRAAATIRDLGRLDQRPALNGMVVLGAYGADRWVVGEPSLSQQPAPAAILKAWLLLRAAITEAAMPGVHLEDKGQAIGVHTRTAADAGAAYTTLLPVVTKIAAETGLTLEPGKNVLELRASTVDKGEAIGSLVAETGARVVAMCGDDLGDLPAFAALNKLHNVGLATCRVVSASAEQAVVASHADVLADGPDGIADWLEELVALLDGSSR